jgi:hypothetical protein
MDPVNPINPVIPPTPVIPDGPVIPTDPVTPMSPVNPISPAIPVAPVTPIEPFIPVGPAAPVAPVAPRGPLNPEAPCFPLGPFGPEGPIRNLFFTFRHDFITSPDPHSEELNGFLSCPITGAIHKEERKQSTGHNLSIFERKRHKNPIAGIPETLKNFFITFQSLTIVY